jgi:hypothetical protein
MAINAAAPAKIKGTSITAPSASGDNHTLVLGQLKEVAEIGQRLRGDPNDSFVRVSEVNSALGTRMVNNTLQPPNSVTQSSGGTVNVADSILGDGSSGSPLQLDGDSASPGNTMVYGTNSSGVKGWYSAAGGSLTSPLTTKGDLWGWDTTNNRIPIGSDGTVLTADSTQTLGLKWGTAATSTQFNKGAGWNSSSGAILVTAITTIDVIIPYACTLQEVDIITSGGSGSCVIDIWKAASLAVPNSGNDITGGVPPAISASTGYSNTSLSGWTTSFAQNDRARFTLVSVTNFTSILISLRLK